MAKQGKGKSKGSMATIMVALGALLLFAGKGNGDLSAYGLIILVIGLVLIFTRGSKSGSRNGYKRVRKWSDPNYYTERYNAENRKRYSDDYVEAVRQNDPRFHI